MHQAVHLSAILRREEALNKRSLVAFIDFEKAYDTVSREILIAKMKSVGFSTQLVTVVSRIIQDRKFTVEIGSSRSSVREARDGLPHGGPLSPLLYNILVGDLPTATDNTVNRTSTLQFADDVAIVASDFRWSRAKLLLENALERLRCYCRKVLGVGSKQKRNLRIQFGTSKIKLTSKARYLGVHFTRFLIWNRHNKLRCQTANHTISKLSPLLRCNNLARSVKRNIEQQVIAAQASYANEVCVENRLFYPTHTYRSLRRAIRVATSLPYYVRTDDMLRSLNIKDLLEDAVARRDNIRHAFKDSEDAYISRIAQMT